VGITRRILTFRLAGLHLAAPVLLGRLVHLAWLGSWDSPGRKGRLGRLDRLGRVA